MTQSDAAATPESGAPVEFVQRRMPGSRFREVDLSGADFDTVYLRDVRVREADLSGAAFRGIYTSRLEVSGDIEVLVVNGVDVMPLVEAELTRRHPERALLHPRDPGGFREAWEVNTRLWAETVARARALDPALLHVQVDGEWSFIETLRHLAFATECWLLRAVLGDPAPWQPLSLPWDQMPDTPGVPRVRAARPTLDEALALRLDRMDRVGDYLARLTDQELAAQTTPVEAPGWPEPRSYAVRRCLETILNEEWWHRQFAERDLAVLETPVPAPEPSPQQG